VPVTDPRADVPNYNINLLATGILHYPHWYQYKGNRIQYNKSANRYKIIHVPVTSQNTDNNFFNYRWDITGENPNITYKQNGNGIWDQAWDLTDNTIAFMTADYKANMMKILPDHGTASNINILDQKMLDSIAQTFYEYSDGLFEIYYIYDVVIIGSNMMDIRFDKKQRLAPETFITLRNQYNPKISEYNKLLSIYEDGTWVESYSNINDLQSNISTSLKTLGPVLNPAYPINNGNPDAIQTEITRLTLSNETLQSQIDNASISAEARLKNEASRLGANVSSSAGLLSLQNSFTTTNPDLNVGDLQDKMNNNIDTINNLLNQLDGIETNVARIFFTMATPSNLVVNGKIGRASCRERVS
jgi:propanediol dehydratase small subunit